VLAREGESGKALREVFLHPSGEFWSGGGVGGDDFFEAGLGGEPIRAIEHGADGVGDWGALVQAIQEIGNDALYLKKMREFIAEHGPLVQLLADINASPKAAKVLNDTATVNLAQALARQATARAGGGNPNHGEHGLFSSASEGGGGSGDAYDPHEQQRRGEAAMEQAIQSKADVVNAMHQRELGPIDFKWGSEGDGPPDYNRGNGVAKIIAKHGEASARKMPEIIAHGKIIAHNGNVVVMEKDGWKAMLTKTAGRDTNHWLLSGYLPKEKGGGR
jgi:hypothetical protein